MILRWAVLFVPNHSPPGPSSDYEPSLRFNSNLVFSPSCLYLPSFLIRPRLRLEFWLMWRGRPGLVRPVSLALTDGSPCDLFTQPSIFRSSFRVLSASQYSRPSMPGSRLRVPLIPSDCGAKTVFRVRLTVYAALVSLGQTLKNLGAGEGRVVCNPARLR